ncbi:MAG: MaoC family dehydratase N-terminal domain-containing protein [Spirochaetaceae bacterium]|nr:MaoC family dehydratase N-terminal domain-containing protein [Spirochaetaceae bacterium]
MYLEDYTIGMEWKTEPVTIGREELVDFTMRYDPHPIHFDDEYAKTTRFKEIIAPGALTYLVVWSPFMKLNPFGDELVAGKSTKMEWHLPVYAGERLSGRFWVSKVEPLGRGKGLLEIQIEIHNQEGKRVLSGFTEAVMQCRPT